jgi:methionine-rich copper-binding protein CopC
VFMDSQGKRRAIRIAVWVAVLGLLLGVLSSLVLASGADAHAALRAISPNDGQTVTAVPAKVVLTFNEPISASFATVTVTGPAGPATEGRPLVDGVTVTQSLRADLVDGRYTVSYRVVSEDGHPVSDTSRFTVAVVATPAADPPTGSTTAATPSATTAAGTTDAPSPAGTAAAGAGQGDESDSKALRVGLAVGVAALALAGGTALIASSRRRSGE